MDTGRGRRDPPVHGAQALRPYPENEHRVHDDGAPRALSGRGPAIVVEGR